MNDRHPGNLFKDLAEILLVREPQLVIDLLDFVIGLQHQMLGLFNPYLINVQGDVVPGLLLEQIADIMLGQVQMGGKGLKGDLLPIIFIDILDGLMNDLVGIIEPVFFKVTLALRLSPDIRPVLLSCTLLKSNVV